MTESVNFDAAREIALIGIYLLDDAYIAWQAAELESEYALRVWFEGVGGQHQAGYHAYRAAVDREEAAAHNLKRLHQLAQLCVEILAVAE